MGHFKHRKKIIKTYKEKERLLEEQKQTEKLETENKQINGKIIKDVTLIDSYTEYSDKLHAFMNYQEIIQTRMYKFKVVFEDNSSKIYTTEEGSKLYNKLIYWVNKESEKNPQINSTIDIPEEIRKYKKLLDDQIISKEEFEKKKQELLNQQEK